MADSTLTPVAKALLIALMAIGRMSGVDDTVRVRVPWHRSMRGEDDSPQPSSVLDVVMVISVSIAVVVFSVWFFFFAGSSLPAAAA